MNFVNPKNIPPIATFRIMNTHGVIEDESLANSGVTDEQVIEWYRNMLTGAYNSTQVGDQILNPWPRIKSAS